jgi:hypothetical protein
MRKFNDCGIISLAHLKHAIETPLDINDHDYNNIAPLLPPSSYYNGHPPLLNYLVVRLSTGKWFKTKTLHKMVDFVDMYGREPIDITPQLQVQVLPHIMLLFSSSSPLLTSHFLFFFILLPQ